MREVLKYLLILAKMNIYAIHLIVYLLSKRKRDIDVDLDQYVKHALHNNTIFKNRHALLMEVLSKYPDFRSSFYIRTGDIGRLLAIIFPGRECFYIFTPHERIGAGLVLHHPLSTRISCRRIGEFCQIWQMVTIGKGKHSEGIADTPILGNNVRVSVGAIIIGSIEIGDNVTIAAGSVVTKNVPSNCTVAGNPAFIIKRNGVRVKEPL